jgi:hypothetical protein
MLALNPPMRPPPMMLKVRICENTERPLQLTEYEKFIKEVLAVQECKGSSGDSSCEIKNSEEEDHCLKKMKKLSMKL